MSHLRLAYLVLPNLTSTSPSSAPKSMLTFRESSNPLPSRRMPSFKASSRNCRWTMGTSGSLGMVLAALYKYCAGLGDIWVRSSNLYMVLWPSQKKFRSQGNRVDAERVFETHHKGLASGCMTEYAVERHTIPMAIYVYEMSDLEVVPHQDGQGFISEDLSIESKALYSWS